MIATNNKFKQERMSTRDEYIYELIGHAVNGLADMNRLMEFSIY